MVANTYLGGTYTEFYSSIEQNEEGMKKLFKQFSFPGGIPSHDAPETPGSIHDRRGELGYALVQRTGAVFDNPDLVACCVVGDGEAEPAARRHWHSNKFLTIRPRAASVICTILHLNGYKIAKPDHTRPPQRTQKN